MSETAAARLHDHLDAIWRSPPGFGQLSAVNHTAVGARYVATAFAFFLVGGLLAMLMRAQLAWPERASVDHATYNALFTMHGTTMMFLFAVPMMEGMAAYLIPKMIGARDLPFPRLGAFTYWCYAFGGLLLYASFLFGAAPDGGWFMYVPLNSKPYSPGMNADFWLLGVSFVEVSAVLAAIELIVAILLTRGPGMSIDRMPLFAWAILVTGFMIVFGFPPLILGSILLEVERAFGIPFYDVTRGGHPLLWQHLFWIFGHPEVYIIFLPATGIVSMVLATFARAPIAGYTWIVLALVGTGFISFGLWVHHMYAVGIPLLALGFFSAASMAVAIPSGIQVFAWIATLWRGRPVLAVPLLYLLGFLFIFVLGGLTGVMIALVPFDWQVHDTHFIVAHFHYVLIGGMVFPLLAGLYYWLPLHTGRVMSAVLGRWAFWLIFAGFNVTFLPMHLTGLVGMPRRVYTYPEGLGWEYLNAVSTVGSFVLTTGFAVFVLDAILHLRHGERAGANPWKAGSLEWSLRTPVPPYTYASLPRIEGREPLWEQPGLAERLERGEGLLTDTSAGERQTLATGVLDGEPERVLRLPGSSWLPLYAAAALAVFFVGALAQAYRVALVGAALTVGVFLRWVWDTERAPPRVIEVGAGLRLSTDGPSRRSPSWWALAIGLLADATLFVSLLFAYFFLWTVSPEWPPAGAPSPPRGLPLLAAGLLLASSAVIAWSAHAARPGRLRVALPAAMLLALAFVFLELAALSAWPPAARAHAYPALVHANGVFAAIHVAIAALMAGFVWLRVRAGYVSAERPLGAHLLALYWHYAVAVSATGVVVVHLASHVL